MKEKNEEIIAKLGGFDQTIFTGRIAGEQSHVDQAAPGRIQNSVGIQEVLQRH